ncbi:hypothetical protein JTE90_019914 [Oedothorax gibbosus]|uniref:Transcriptional adapter n=1 Tax=Oedothorax gibbosus TaxID=931172 RepID=A0AAV6UQ49_9ARAC|nr:hypothetical protein JTE90_019914 [Oedothorax gibbosus]
MIFVSQSKKLDSFCTELKICRTLWDLDEPIVRDHINTMEDLLACPVCGIFLQEPYIRCFECHDPSRSFCLQCFSKGKDYENHKNNHSYTVVKNNFSLFDPDWTASEELKLLNAIVDRGLGNWSEISRDVGTKTKVECEEHYFKHYIYQPTLLLPEIVSPQMEDEICQPTPVNCTTLSQDPPRPVVGSILYQDMAGYMPARGDFAYEYDDFAEMDIKDLAFEDDDDPLWNELQMGVLDIYQSRLKERARRKLLIKEYGLLNNEGNVVDWKRYSPLGPAVLDHIKPLMHLFPAENFYKFMEGLLWEHKATQRIQLLQECRSAGITRLHSIPTFLKLKKKQEENKKSKSALDEVLSQIKDERTCQQFINRQVIKELKSSGPGRQSAPPLNIATLPNFEKLNPKEMELCSNHRIMPTYYLQYKATLLNEYGKLGYLRLANARKIIKIDVNKTRHIYDLLLEQGLITK